MNIYEYLRLKGQLPPTMGGTLPGIGAGQGGSAMALPGFTTYAPAPLMDPPQKKPGGGLWGAMDRVLGGSAMNDLTPEQRKDARRQGLLALGAGLLTATDPRGNRAQGLSAVGQGIMAGQWGYGQGIQQGQQQQAATQDAALWSEFQPRPGESIQNTYARLQQMMWAATQMGNDKRAQMIAGVLQTLPGLMKDKGNDAPLKPWEKEGFSTAEEQLKYLRQRTSATQRPFRPMSATGSNPYMQFLGQQIDDVRGQISSKVSAKEYDEEYYQLSNDLSNLMAERLRLSVDLPGAPAPQQPPALGFGAFGTPRRNPYRR